MTDGDNYGWRMPDAVWQVWLAPGQLTSGHQVRASGPTSKNNTCLAGRRFKRVISAFFAFVLISKYYETTR